MNLRTFIERPILSAVISISIVVVGIIGLFTLPVEQYPDIAPPTIQVRTSYLVPVRKLFRRVLSLRWRKRLTVWKI